MPTFRPERVLQYIDRSFVEDTGSYLSSPRGVATLYATCYALLTRRYLGAGEHARPATLDFILSHQSPETGCFCGPELIDWDPSPTARYDKDYLLTHLTCAVLPVLAEYGLRARFELQFARRYCDPAYLRDWLDRRDLRNAWLEGNKLLFAGQLLIYLHEAEGRAEASDALEMLFNWLDSHVDPATGLWGTDGCCSPFVGMCGAYHQLLLYYYRGREVLYRERLIDSVLSLQHEAGGFSPGGGGGACEDADAADILVNAYKHTTYRRSDVRAALRRCLRHLCRLQNPDGGFPYNKRVDITHNGIPATACPKGCSNMFSTWFRVHTLALIAEVITDDARLSAIPFRFNKALSMGWHRPWNKRENRLDELDRISDLASRSRFHLSRLPNRCRRLLRVSRRLLATPCRPNARGLTGANT